MSKSNPNLVMCVGPSGCGKTTLLNAIAGLTTSRSEIYLDEELIASPKMKQTPGLTASLFFKTAPSFPGKRCRTHLWADHSGKMKKNEAIAEARSWTS
jgi:ABC-type nitrate/sulfonate/bicarbonate transport system ATPase subunit